MKAPCTPSLLCTPHSAIVGVRSRSRSKDTRLPVFLVEVLFVFCIEADPFTSNPAKGALSHSGVSQAWGGKGELKGSRGYQSGVLT